MEFDYVGIVIICVALLCFFLAGIRIIRPTTRGLQERLGKYLKFCQPGFHWVIPIVDRMVYVNITEQMVDAKKQEIITNDNLNAVVDAQIYFKVIPTENGVKASQYNVDDVQWQIVNLARTTLRNIIGTLTLKTANSERDTINNELMKTLLKETSSWGISVVRTELKEIQPPEDVQDTMNKIVKAENEKISATDYATAVETKANGERRAAIQMAEGQKRAQILAAEGKAQAIQLENEALRKHFKDEAQVYKQLETAQIALSNGTKYIIDSNSKLATIVTDVAGANVVPVRREIRRRRR